MTKLRILAGDAILSEGVIVCDFSRNFTLNSMLNSCFKKLKDFVNLNHQALVPGAEVPYGRSIHRVRFALQYHPHFRPHNRRVDRERMCMETIFLFNQKESLLE